MRSLWCHVCSVGCRQRIFVVVNCSCRRRFIYLRLNPKLKNYILITNLLYYKYSSVKAFSEAQEKLVCFQERKNDPEEQCCAAVQYCRWLIATAGEQAHAVCFPGLCFPSPAGTRHPAPHCSFLRKICAVYCRFLLWLVHHNKSTWDFSVGTICLGPTVAKISRSVNARASFFLRGSVLTWKTLI